jgi:hypothetical protein
MPVASAHHREAYATLFISVKSLHAGEHSHISEAAGAQGGFEQGVPHIENTRQRQGLICSDCSAPQNRRLRSQHTSCHGFRIGPSPDAECSTLLLVAWVGGAIAHMPHECTSKVPPHVVASL